MVCCFGVHKNQIENFKQNKRKTGAVFLEVKLLQFFFFLNLHSSHFHLKGGMVYYQMPHYSPYHQAMLVHYAPPSYGRSAGTSAFAAGDAVAAGTIVRGA